MKLGRYFKQFWDNRARIWNRIWKRIFNELGHRSAGALWDATFPENKDKKDPNEKKPETKPEVTPEGDTGETAIG